MSDKCVAHTILCLNLNKCPIFLKENCTPATTVNPTLIEKEAISLPASASILSWPLSNQCGLQQADSTNYAMSVSNSSQAGGENNIIPDTVLCTPPSVVRSLQDCNVEATRATSLERTALVEAHQAEMSLLVAKCEKRVAEVEFNSKGKMQELICHLEKAFYDLCQLSGVQTTLTTSQTELEDCKKRVLELQAEVKKKTIQIEESNGIQTAKAAEMQALKVESEKKLRLSQEATEASAKEVHLLKTDIKGKEKLVDDMTSESRELVTKCQKLEAQLAIMEQKTAQDSLNSGSYADGHANPSMLQEVACKSVDKATDALAKFLHDNSITKSCPLNSKELEHFVHRICPASPVDFSRTLQVKYAWSHWICFIMFQGFEHCFFDADSGQLTSPFDPKNQALICFDNFQQKKDLSSSDLHKGCDMFRAFCTMKYADVFPQWLVRAALCSNSPDDVLFDDCGRFNGDARIFTCFLDVAKAVWLLHELAFSFDPPATILRMAWGTAFDKQFHESVIHDEDTGGASKVVLMIRPAFRVRNTIVRSRVFSVSMKSLT